MGKAKREADRAARRKKIYAGMPEWKRKKMQQHEAGIKSGTDPARWRDPKTGEKVKIVTKRDINNEMS